MPRNKTGGKNAKRQGNKHVNASNNQEEEEIVEPTEDQFIGIVTKINDLCHYDIELNDANKTQGFARLPGSNKRLGKRIKIGSVILFSPWFPLKEETKSKVKVKGDLLHLYSDAHSQLMIRHGIVDNPERVLDGNYEGGDDILIDLI